MLCCKNITITFFSSELQFGFKAKHSTHMCTMILKETLMYYNTNNSTAFCTFLDASKAFDRVRYCKLFRILIDRGLPPCIVRVLICLYTNKVRVAWNRVQSQYFLAVNGAKQGGVMSPVLYLLCTDGLLVKLLNSGVGCFLVLFLWVLLLTLMILFCLLLPLQPCARCLVFMTSMRRNLVVMDDFKISKLDRFRLDFLKKI